MVTIHEKNSIVFNTLGLGALLPSLCVVTEELNGMYELEMEHPYDADGKWKRIEKEQIIFASTPRGRQPFRIYHVRPNMDGITVNARHIFYDLLDNVCMNVDVTGTPQAVLNAIKNAFVYSTPFVLTSDMTGTGTVKATRENPITALLKCDDDATSFIKAFAGEILRDGFYVAMKTSIGQDRGVAIRYGKNLVGLTVSEDTTDVVTRIYPIATNGATLPELYIDSPYIDAYANPKMYVLEGFYYFTDMRGEAQKMLDGGCDLPKVNITADFQELSKTEEYKDYAILEEVQLGDVVTVSNVKMGFHKKAKVISYEWDSLLERYNKVELGDFVADLTTSVTSGEKSFATAVGASTEVKQVYGLISGKTTINVDGLYICVDGTGISNATKLFHFGSNGLRYSSTGVNGTWKTIINAEGNLGT
ncbi:phage tail spike protein [Anaerotignum sp.]|uniref:phage tail spike protein n=1 Tax=Anaerotignum sp. TaxID=2039241 RepID=UPI0028A82C03|nr:phage tail spike protein [Anaerotignum sp.]